MDLQSAASASAGAESTAASTATAAAEDERFGVRKKLIIDEHWKVGKFIREGLFRSYYFEITDLLRPILSFTLKIESNAPQKPDDPPRFLLLEEQVLSSIKQKNCRYNIGFECSGEEEKYHYLIMNSVGRNVDEIRNTFDNRRFTLRTVLHIARRSLYCIEELHNAGFIHRDVKPGNMFIGNPPDDLRQLYLGNLELCRQFVADNGDLYPPRERAAFRGSPRYASVNAQQEKEQGRMDDMWSWLFNLIEMSIGKLPWDDESLPITKFILRVIPPYVIFSTSDNLRSGDVGKETKGG